MSASNAIRFLAKSDGTDDTQLGLTYFMGSLVKAFEEDTLLFNSPYVFRQTVMHGKSWQYLMQSILTPGMNDAEDHTPGDELLGQPFAYDQGTITADSLISAHRDIPIDHEIWSHFPVLAAQGQALGYALRQKVNRRLFQTAILSYRTAAATKNSLTLHNGGSIVTRTGSAAIATAYPTTPAGAAAIRSDLADLAYTFDVANVPPENRGIYLHKHFRRVLTKDAGYVWGTPSNAAGVANSTLFSSDYGATGNDINRRVIAEIEGFKVMGFYSTRSSDSGAGEVPAYNVTTGPSKYQVNCVGTTAGTNGIPVAMAFAAPQGEQAALGMVTFQGINPVISNDDRRSTTFLKAEMLCGAGKMHPWMCGAVEIGSA